MAWTFLSPLAKLYGEFEPVRDSTDMLQHIELTNTLIRSRNTTNLEDIIIFTIDVKELYPSVKFTDLFDALHDCLKNVQIEKSPNCHYT